MKIVWTEPAVADLESIRDYISRDSEHYATRLIERIFETIENLKKFPNKGRKVPEAEQENIREILFQNYRIIYQLEKQRIIVLTILHSARDLTRRYHKSSDVD